MSHDNGPLFALFFELANGKVGLAELYRRLAETRELAVPARRVGDGAVPMTRTDGATEVVTVFTGKGPYEAWSRSGGQSEAIKMVWGMSLFGEMPPFVGGVDVDPASPLPLQIRGDEVVRLAAAARAVQVEYLLANPSDPAAPPLIPKYAAFQILMTNGSWQTTRIDETTGELAIAFSCDEAIDAYFRRWPDARDGAQPLLVPGVFLLEQVTQKGLGLLTNPAGPNVSVLSFEMCRKLVPGN